MGRTPNTSGTGPDQLIKVVPMSARPSEPSRPGPKPKHRFIPMQFEMSPDEEVRFLAFQETYTREYKLKEVSDLMMLELAAVQYILFLRVAAWEIANNQTITMSRQHPGARMESLLDRLSVNRKDRLKSKGDGDDTEARETKEWLRGLSKSG